MSNPINQRAKFNLIRYGQCWEDADILLKSLNIQPTDTCLSIASAGDNSFALLTANPKKVIALDLSLPQLHCLHLRKAAYQTLEHAEFLELYGALPSSQREELFARCLAVLPEDSRTFWLEQKPLVLHYGLGGTGKFEKYFRLFGARIVPLIHSRQTVLELFKDKPLEARQKFYQQTWNTWRWRLFIKLFFSRTSMGLLGRDPAFFDHVEGSVSTHVLNRILHAFQILNPAENPYLQWIFLGRFTTALPLALRPEHYATIRANLHKLEIRAQSVEDFVATNTKVDAFNLSDIFEYMDISTYKEVHRKLCNIANPGARLAYWNMMAPRQADAYMPWVKRNDALSQSLHEADKTFFYTNFNVDTVL